MTGLAGALLISTGVPLTGAGLTYCVAAPTYGRGLVVMVPVVIVAFVLVIAGSVLFTA